MAERCYNCADWQARALAEGRLSLLVRPCELQPQYDGIYRILRAKRGSMEGCPIPCGTERREAWLYRADRPDYRGPWRSATQMPKELARFRRRVTRVEARRVSHITNDEALATGCERCIQGPEEPGRDARDDFEAAWRERHGNRYPWESAWAWFVWHEEA